MPRLGGPLILPEAATASITNPAAGSRALYFKTDGLLYKKNSAGTEEVIGGSATATQNSIGFNTGSFTFGGMLFQWGTIAVNMSGATNQVGTVTYNDAFGAAPNVTMGIIVGATQKLFASLNGGNPSSTSFGWAVRSGDLTTSTASPTVTWLAIGRA